MTLRVALVTGLYCCFDARGMARALSAMALAQALVALVALGLPSSGPLEIVAVNGLFVALFAGSAYLFRRAFIQ